MPIEIVRQHLATVERRITLTVLGAQREHPISCVDWCGWTFENMTSLDAEVYGAATRPVFGLLWEVPQVFVFTYPAQQAPPERDK